MARRVLSCNRPGAKRPRPVVGHPGLEPGANGLRKATYDSLSQVKRKVSRRQLRHLVSQNGRKRHLIRPHDTKRDTAASAPTKRHTRAYGCASNAPRCVIACAALIPPPRRPLPAILTVACAKAGDS